MGIWFKMQGAPAPKGSVILFDNQPLKTAGNAEVITATIPPEYLEVVGKKAIALRLGADGGEIQVGEFEVTAAE